MKTKLFTLGLILHISLLANSQVNLQSGLVAYYPFNGDAKDESGNGNDGTVNGATPTTDRFGNVGKAFGFDGVDDNVSINNSNLVNQFTFSTHIKINNIGIYSQTIISKFNDYDGEKRSVLFQVVEGKVQICVFKDGKGYSNHYLVESKSKLIQDAWYHVVVEYNANSTLKLYINGTLESEKNDIPIFDLFQSNVMNLIGQNENDWSSRHSSFSGCIDDIRIYNRALSAEEITQLYNSEKPATDLNTGLVAYYPFNGDAKDESGNGNDGTVNGATPTTDRFGNVGKAFDFDGVDDNITATSNKLLNNNFTFSVWKKNNTRPTVNNNWAMLCLGDHIEGDLTLNISNNYGGNGIQGYTAGFYTSPTTTVGISTTENYLSNNWNLITFTSDGSVLKIYTNGVLNNSINISSNPHFGTNAILAIGSRTNNIQYYNGILDDIRIYNRALSSDEITQLYNSEKPATDLTTGLVAYYPFNGNANDESGNGNNGTVNGATPTTDRFGNVGKAYSFDGVNDYINVKSNLAVNDNITISTWFYATGFNETGINMILSKTNCSEYNGTFSYGLWGLGANNQIICFQAAPVYNSSTYGNNRVNKNEWYNFIATYNKSTTTLSYYLNGSLVSTRTIGFMNFNNSEDLNIGVQICGNLPQWFFKGTIDDIRIYNRVLSTEEIHELYNEKITCPELPSRITIKKFIPDINPTAHVVKELATIHQYYIVKDADTDLPVENVIATYTLDDGNEVFKSLPSDKLGILEISFPVYGKNIEDASDDYIKSYETKSLKFKSIECGENVNIVKNDFFAITVSVYPFDSDTKKYGFVFSGDMDIDWGLKNWYSSILKGKLDVKPGVKLSFTNIFENGVLSGMEYTNKSDLKGTLSTELPGIPIVPFFKGEVSFTPVSKIYFKETLPTNWQSYLKIYYDLGASLLDKTYNTDEDLHYSLNAISSFLGISNQTKTTIGTSSSNEFKVEAGFSPEINFGGGVSAEISLKGGYEVDFEAGTQKKLDGSINEMVLTNSISSTTTKSFDVDLGFTNVKTKYGASGGASLSNSITISSTKLDNLDLLKEAHIVINKSADLSLNGSFGDVQQNGDNTVEQIKEIGASLSKEYSTDNVLGDSFLKSLKNDYKNGVFVSPLARFIVKENINTSSPLDLYLDNPVNEFKNYLSDKTSFIQNSDNVNQSLNSTTTKSYTVLGKYSNKIGFKASDHSLWGDKNYKGGVGSTFGIFLESEYPVDEQIYNFNLKRSFTRVNYIDDDKIKYLFSPLNPISDLWNNMNTAIKSYAKEIYEKSKDFLNTILDEIADEIINIGNSTTRRYSKNLVQYQKLKSLIQSDISTINFQIEGNNKVFNTGTKIKLDYYYPGGEVLGVTNMADTFVIVSDIFYLNAYYQNDTLKTAPNGKFKVIGKVGLDDLKFLGLDTNSLASVYFKAQDSIRWELLGNVGETLESNVLGTYAIGVSVGNDNIEPEINLAENIVSNTLKVNISDNIGLNWKKTSVFVNGISTSYNRIANTGEIEIDLLKFVTYFDEIQVSIIAYDLSGNSNQKTKSYNGLNSSIQYSEKKNEVKLMPNPAFESFSIYLPDFVENNTSYSIVDVYGREIANKPILSNNTKIDVNFISEGLYFVIIINRNVIIDSKKLIIKK